MCIMRLQGEERKSRKDIWKNKSQVLWLTPVIPALWEVKVGGSFEARSSRPAWPTWQNPVSTKNTKNSEAWWHMPVVPATRGTEVEWSTKNAVFWNKTLSLVKCHPPLEGITWYHVLSYQLQCQWVLQALYHLITNWEEVFPGIRGDCTWEV